MSFQKCAIEGCQYAGVSSYSAGRYYCDFHGELFDRGSDFKRCTYKVTQYASWWAVRDLKAKLGRIASCTLESDAKKLIDVVQQSPLRQYLPDPSVLDRKEIVNGIGERVPEPARMYALRVDSCLVNFIVDKAIFDMGLPVLGEGLQGDLPLGQALKEGTDG
jgi:hypothetical protein|nr:MAG TPA_asm: hypothetical protein [Caudoviricetes sp.]